MKKRSIEELKEAGNIQILNRTEVITGGSMSGMTSETEIVE